MSNQVIHLREQHSKEVIPILRKSHSFASDREARIAYLHDLKEGQRYRGVYDNGLLCGAMSWQQRGLYKHGVVEIPRFSFPEEHFRPDLAETLYDTMIANIDWVFTRKRKQVRKIFLIIGSTKEQAKRFFMDRGFVLEAELKRHYHMDRDEQVLSLFM